MSLLTVFHESQLFVSLVVSLNRLWTQRAKHSALFTLAAPTEAIAVPFTWWTEGGTNQCLLKWGKCGWWPKCLFFLRGANGMPILTCGDLYLHLSLTLPLLYTSSFCFPQSQHYHNILSLPIYLSVYPVDWKKIEGMYSVWSTSVP